MIRQSQVYSIVEGDDAEGEAFYGKPPELVLAALRHLGKSQCHRCRRG